jgi:hypothetical protein
MNKDIKIEHYLLQLDRELQALPVSQRAEIITEIKSHITDAEAKSDVDTVLRDLGSPQAVAQRYLAAKGVSYAKPRRSGAWVKWLAIGTVAFFGLIFFAGMSAIWYFSPLVKVDEDKGRVVLLGGLIDVNEKIGKVKIGDMEVNGSLKDDVEVKGEEMLTGNVKSLKIPFNTAKLDLAPAAGRKITWDCRAASSASPEVAINAGVMTLNLDKLNLAKCTVSIPLGISTFVTGVNGHMDVTKPGGPLEITLDNGKVNIKPDPSKTYDFEVKVKNGLQDFFPRSNAKGALKVKVSVVNGLVKKE